MQIVEIFKSLQGESTYAGLPCTFIRLSGCNLRCKWCDTTYSFTEAVEMDVDAIIRKVGELECALVEITGGEPLCQEEELLVLIRRLLELNYRILLETNGSLSLKNIPPAVVKIMDIKPPSSGMAGSFLAENLDYLQNSDEIKFVIDDWADYIYAADAIRAYQLEVRSKLLISKTGSGSLTHAELADRIIKDNLPVRYQIQLHKIIWQDARGK